MKIKLQVAYKDYLNYFLLIKPRQELAVRWNGLVVHKIRILLCVHKKSIRRSGRNDVEEKDRMKNIALIYLSNDKVSCGII